MVAVFQDIGLLALAGMAATVMIANLLRAFTGFGFALAALPVFSLILSPTSSVSVIVLLTLAVSLQTFGSYRRDIPLGDMTGMIAASAVGTVGGSFLLLLISPDIFRLLIGGTVMAACLLLARYRPAPHRAGGLFGLSSGLTSGLLNGALAIPGPPVIIYSMAVYEKARTARAFLLGFFLFSAAFATLSYGAEGYIGQRELLIALVCYPAMLAGEKLGTYLFDRYGDASHRNIAIAALFVIGLSVAVAAVT